MSLENSFSSEFLITFFTDERTLTGEAAGIGEPATLDSTSGLEVQLRIAGQEIAFLEPLTHFLEDPGR
jgi:hypothetical protein